MESSQNENTCNLIDGENEMCFNEYNMKTKF